jgi:hypothetical protein
LWHPFAAANSGVVEDSSRIERLSLFVAISQK